MWLSLGWAGTQHANALLLAPCDAPFLTPALWRDLLQLLDQSGTDAAIAATPAKTHPLCAALRPSLASPLKAYLANPNAKLAVRAFLEGVRVATLSLPDDAQFMNINSQEDLARASAFASQARST
jgi:molybdenum cofactor guanylyltransferase